MRPMLSTKGTRTHFRLPVYFVLAEAAKLCVAAGCVVDKDDQVPSCKHGNGKSNIYRYRFQLLERGKFPAMLLCWKVSSLNHFNDSVLQVKIDVKRTKKLAMRSGCMVSEDLEVPNPWFFNARYWGQAGIIPDTSPPAAAGRIQKNNVNNEHTWKTSCW